MEEKRCQNFADVKNILGNEPTSVSYRKKSVKEFENNRWLGSSWSLNFFFQTQVAWTGQTFWRRCPLFYINLFVDE